MRYLSTKIASLKRQLNEVFVGLDEAYSDITEMQDEAKSYLETQRQAWLEELNKLQQTTKVTYLPHPPQAEKKDDIDVEKVALAITKRMITLNRVNPIDANSRLDELSKILDYIQGL